MWKSVTKFFTPPTFENDENKTRVALYVHWIALAFMGAILATIAFSKIDSGAFSFNFFDVILVGAFALIAFARGMSRNGRVRGASVFLIVILWVAVNGTAYFAGVRDTSYIANFIVLIAAGLLLGWKAAVFLSVLTIAAGVALANAEIAGVTPSIYTPASPLIAIRDMSLIFGIFAALTYLLISGLENALNKARSGATALADTNRDLDAARLRLEENRNELLAANQQLQQRAEKINAIANIAKTITLVQEIERLLPSVAASISGRFGYYHAGVYLLDESGQNALLRASSSEGGLLMIRRKYRVKVPSNELIANVADRGEARIADVDEIQTTRINQRELTETRSQIVLPLKVREIVIGVLDIHSSQPDAFSREDVPTLQILADQVAIAIQNARSSEQARDALQKAEIISHQLTNKAWREYSDSQDRKGYRYDGIKPEPIHEKVRFTDSDKPLAIPIVLRGQVIGNLKMNPTEATRRWTDDEVAMAEATAERVALALEGARLLEDAQKRAQRETFLSEVSTKLGASFQVDSILRDTVEELGQTFRNATVSFQLVNPASQPEAGSDNDAAKRGNGSTPE